MKRIGPVAANGDHLEPIDDASPTVTVRFERLHHDPALRMLRPDLFPSHAVSVGPNQPSLNF
jgi:hypothetical protein